MERQLLTHIGLDHLERAFAMAEENLRTDISAIRISMIRDIHYDSIDLYVLVFGQDNDQEAAPVAELWIDPEVIGSDSELNDEGIEPSRLRTIFSQEVLNLIGRRCVPIHWLCEDGNILTLSMSPGDDFGIRLQPIDQ